MDGLELGEQSPFEAAALIQASRDGSNKPSVAIKVSSYFQTLAVLLSSATVSFALIVSIGYLGPKDRNEWSPLLVP